MRRAPLWGGQQRQDGRRERREASERSGSPRAREMDNGRVRVTMGQPSGRATASETGLDVSPQKGTDPQALLPDFRIRLPCNGQGGRGEQSGSHCNRMVPSHWRFGGPGLKQAGNCCVACRASRLAFDPLVPSLISKMTHLWGRKPRTVAGDFIGEFRNFFVEGGGSCFHTRAFPKKELFLFMVGLITRKLPAG